MSLPAAFLNEVQRLIPAERRSDDPLSTLAFSTDASFCRLIPRLGGAAKRRWRWLR